MQILAHRGFWQRPEERNTLAALERALREGFGLETDVRDAAGELVIAHDPPVGPAPLLAEVLALARTHGTRLPLALNLKSDGLRGRLKSLLQSQPAQNYFCFDMSVPETLACRRDGLRYFTRESEFEPSPVLYAEAAGVWLDMFTSDWLQPSDIARHLDAGKEAAIVSPELHGRPHLDFWARLRAAGLGTETRVLLCTDLPAEAAAFFHA